MLFITATLLIQLELEERSETLDKRFSAMQNVYRRASEAKALSIRSSITKQMHKCPITMKKPNGMTWQKKWGAYWVEMDKGDILLFYFKKGCYSTPAV